MTDIVERLLDAKIESYSDRLEAADTILRLRAALSELLDYSDSDYGKKTRIEQGIIDRARAARQIIAQLTSASGRFCFWLAGSKIAILTQYGDSAIAISRGGLGITSCWALRAGIL